MVEENDIYQKILESPEAAKILNGFCLDQMNIASGNDDNFSIETFINHSALITPDAVRCINPMGNVYDKVSAIDRMTAFDLDTDSLDLDMQEFDMDGNHRLDASEWAAYRMHMRDKKEKEDKEQEERWERASEIEASQENKIMPEQVFDCVIKLSAIFKEAFGLQENNSKTTSRGKIFAPIPDIYQLQLAA